MKQSFAADMRDIAKMILVIAFIAFAATPAVSEWLYGPVISEDGP